VCERVCVVEKESVTVCVREREREVGSGLRSAVHEKILQGSFQKVTFVRTHLVEKES